MAAAFAMITPAMSGEVDELTCEAVRARTGVVLALPSDDALLLVLSPRMPYALREWPRMQAIAQAMGFTVLARRDPRVPEQEWRAATQALASGSMQDLPVVDEKIARQLGLLHHAPAAMLARDGQLHPWPIYGVMPSVSWASVLSARRLQLRTLACN